MLKSVCHKLREHLNDAIYIYIWTHGHGHGHECGCTTTHVKHCRVGSYHEQLQEQIEPAGVRQEETWHAISMHVLIHNIFNCITYAISQVENQRQSEHQGNTCTFAVWYSVPRLELPTFGGLHLEKLWPTSYT